MSVPGDAKLVLQEMLAMVEPGFDTAKHQPWVDHLNTFRATFWENAQALLNDYGTPLRPERAVRCFNQALEAYP